MNTVRQIVDSCAASHADKVFLIAPESGKQMTFSDLREHCQQISLMLDAHGADHDDKIALLMPNGYWTAALFLGVMYSGRVIVPLNAVAGESALEYVIEHSDTRLVLVDDSYREKFSSLLQGLPDSIQQISSDVETGPVWSSDHGFLGQPLEITEASPALLIYTSGTTGRPKGVLLTNKNVIAGGRNTAEAHELHEDDRAYCVLPLYHINAEIVTIMAPLVSAGSVVLPLRFSATLFWQQLAEHDCTWFSVVPTIIAYLLEQGEREGFDRDALGGLPRLRIGRSASAPLAPEMHKQFETLFAVPIVETMGLSETTAQILSNPMPPAKPKYGSPGVAVGNEAKVIDEQGETCPAGVPGELMIRGENVTGGYYKNPEATAEALESDGWLHTGDIAFCDEDGFYFITGRIKELIIKGGENIAPREIDEALYRHPSVLEAAGFAVPDDRYGQEVMACVALKPGASCSEAELSQLMDKTLGKFKAPKRVYFLDELPKGPSGKIQRLKLAEIFDKPSAA